MEASGKKYRAILAYEAAFARAVSMEVIYRKPLTVWHFLIPFVFIFDYIRMRNDTEIFSKNFLFIKKLALDAALEINRGEDRQSKLAQIEDETRDWLTSKKLYSWGIHQEQIAEVNLLIDHYSKLLEAEGDSYQSLVKNAYKTQEQFRAFLQQLSSVEKEMDRAVVRTLSATGEVWESMLTKQTVINELRKANIRRLFSEMKRGQE